MIDAEARWIRAARRGDQTAFRHLVEAHARPLLHVCQRLLGDVASAEDAVQEALLNAWRGLERFDGRSAFSSWLHRIAVNVALGVLRQRRIEFSIDTDEDDGGGVALLLPDGSHDPFERAAGHEIGRRVAQALEALSTAERTAFVLRHFEQYPMEEIAQALDSNVNACKQAVFRAVRKLRLALTPVRSEP